MPLHLNCLWRTLFPSPQHVTFTKSPAFPKSDGDFGWHLQWLWPLSDGENPAPPHKHWWFPTPHRLPHLQDQQWIIHFSAPTFLPLTRLIGVTSHFSPLVLVTPLPRFFFAFLPLPKPIAWVVVEQGGIGWGKTTQPQLPSNFSASFLPREKKRF